MEVGAVKQAFNNELIILKKNLKQAKLQLINKLTRKAKTLTEKKCPEHLKDKMKRKAESAIREVLVIKKVKSKDIGKFAITHKGKLEDYLNKPQVDMNKACARLLLHKSMQEKYKTIRNKFLDVPIKDLFMSRQERLKIKKEAREKQKEKAKKKREKKNAVNAEGDWDVEDVKVEEESKKKKDVLAADESNLQDSDDEGKDLDSNNESCDEDMQESISKGVGSDDENSDEDMQDANEESENESDVDDESVSDDDDQDAASVDDEEIDKHSKGNFVNLTPGKVNEPKSKIKPILNTEEEDDLALPTDSISKIKLKAIEKEIIKKQTKKPKDNKNKNLNEKLNHRKFKKDVDEQPSQQTKIVDPFFITSTGENYMSVAEPRQPDEFKEEHRQGNRKERRAAMFGNVLPRRKPRQDNFRDDKNSFNNNRFDRTNKGFNNDKFNKNDRFSKDSGRFNSNNKFNKSDGFNDKFNKRDAFGSNKDNSFKNSKFNDRGNDRTSFKNKNESRNDQESKPEKLHPSWEAKKRQSGILPFQGKKIVFGDN